MVTQYFEQTRFDLFQACDWLLRVDWLILVHAWSLVVRMTAWVLRPFQYYLSNIEPMEG